MRGPRCPLARIRPTRLQGQHGAVSGVGSQPDEQFRDSEVTLLACAVQGCQGLLSDAARAALLHRPVPLPCSLSGPGYVTEHQKDLGSSGAYWAVHMLQM